MAKAAAVSLYSATSHLSERFDAVRAATCSLTRNLTPEDQMVQSCPEASPVKWHLAHTTWFFETFLLREFVRNYRPFNRDFFWLFNSYYKSLGEHPEKRLRASFSRPSMKEVLAYRTYVETGIQQLLEENTSIEMLACIEPRMFLGIHHEQQHQELIATDIKHAFWSNPLQPSFVPPFDAAPATEVAPQRWISYSGGLVEIGHNSDSFAFDNESPRHSVYLELFYLASRAVTCGEYLDFIQDDGYRRPELWLSDGWDTVRSLGWNAPLYWHTSPDGTRSVFTLRGRVALDDLLATPVCHISYYEADAYARWSGGRLPTESEWEHAASSVPVNGNLLEHGVLHPMPPENGARNSNFPIQLFGDVWEWTQSPYIAYPRYKPLAGALGEYNGKFMCNQFVLRGGSVVTPTSHIRATYRNFFHPATRWQFSGIRLAKDGDAA